MRMCDCFFFLLLLLLLCFITYFYCLFSKFYCSDGWHFISLSTLTISIKFLFLSFLMASIGSMAWKIPVQDSM